MSVWQASPVSVDPVKTATVWRIVRFVFEDGFHSDHIVGYFDSGRISSSLELYDPKTNIAITKSGRRYKLPVDAIGKHPSSEYVREVWKSHNSVVSEEDVSDLYVLG